MYSEEDLRADEETLILGLAEALEVGQVSIPDDPDERFRILRTLMNVRPPEPVDDDLLETQDRILTYLRDRKGVTDVSVLEFRDGIALWRGDITTLRCDAIVNAANSGMLGCFAPCHRCIDNAIHTFAGMQMRLECQDIMNGMQEPVGHVRVTKGYNIPCRYVMHTVGPMIHGNVTDTDRDALRSCYTSCLEMASSMELETIAFCCISTGEFRFPNREAAEIAVDTVRNHLGSHDGLKVIFDVFTDRDEGIYHDLLG